MNKPTPQQIADEMTRLLASDDTSDLETIRAQAVKKLANRKGDNTNRRDATELKAKGVAKAEIARRLGISRERVSQIIGKSPEALKRANARRILLNTVKAGYLKRAACEVCGNPKSEAHHEDYDKPLDVIWLCKEHHTKIHNKNSNGKPESAAQRKARQRARIRQWLTRVHGVSTADALATKLYREWMQEHHPDMLKEKRLK